MESSVFKQILLQNTKTFETLLAPVSDEQARWKPAPEKWSLLEVINHLHDEELNDFPMRLDLLLHQPEASWPPIDPESWVTEKKYNQRDFTESLKRFLDARHRSIQWFEKLDEPDWKNTYDHPKAGKISAGDLLAAWTAHDFFHLKQMADLQIAYVVRLAEPFSISYALP